jgi:hypothetical protein
LKNKEIANPDMAMVIPNIFSGEISRAKYQEVKNIMKTRLITFRVACVMKETLLNTMNDVWLYKK